ncbi:vacuolar protein sorting 55 [Anaeromyces robustus]|uniref:Vacuolar protein sorting 55 n=1 Tax=Anaeromyces robustus TaxID=1754192 RepID=A0A1Y1X0G9_9FUNG|nr:vacuolar protein sorting 55 [Anaeromyces robustus]|eukprot:ORX79108.1 vacuolar protein sorting 55 [Anaeromyces robustus]
MANNMRGVTENKNTNNSAALLSVGVLLVILSCTNLTKFLPLLVILTYFIAPIPNFIARRLVGGGSKGEFEDEEEVSTTREYGNFITGILFVTGIAIPLVLLHSDMINVLSTILSLIGGLMIFCSFLIYAKLFLNSNSDNEGL